MPARELLEVIKSGNKEQKIATFNSLLEKAVNGLIEDDEIPLLEFLKKELINTSSQTVQIEAVVNGIGGVNS